MIRTLYLARANATLVDAEGMILKTYYCRHQPTHIFNMKNEIKNLIQLIELGFSDRTPMHLAAERGHTATVEFLADKFKASVFDRTKDGSTLMHIAALNGHPDTAMVLFKKGVPLLMPNKV